MKIIVAVALALVAVVAAAPVQEEPIPIVRSSFEQTPEGGFHSSFESGNGIVQEAFGELKAVTDEENKPHEVVVTRGTYSYTSSDGQPISISWEADENGFRATGDSIPKAQRR